MRRAVHIAVTAAVIGAVFLGVLAPAGASEQRASRVVIVLAPYLQWSDVDPARAPTIHRLAENGAIGNINLRNRNRAASAATPLRGALTFSAGTWAAADRTAAQPHSVDEHYEGGAAADAFARATGVEATGHEIVFLGLPRTVRLNDEVETLAVRVGALGQAIVDAGGVTGAIGNSDSGYEVQGVWRNRPAAVVAMDESGRIMLGDVSNRLLVNESEAPFGFATNLDVFADVHERVTAEMTARGGPSLLVLDAGEPHRAFEIAPDVMPAVAEAHRVAAVRALDEVVRMALEGLPEDGVLMVLPQVIAEEAGVVSGLAPAIVYGQGWSGYLSSSSTQRDGLVTNLDVAATVLSELGSKRPVEVLGNPMVSDGGTLSAAQRIRTLEDANATAVAVDRVRAPVLNTFIAGTTILFLLCTLVLLRARRWPERAVRSVSTVARRALLLILAFPPAALLMFLLDGRPQTTAEVFQAFLLTLAGLWIVGLLLERILSSRAVVAVFSVVVAVAISVDQLAGAPLAFTGFLTYSQLHGARYYGLGNEGAALLFGASAVGMALVLDELKNARWKRLLGMWGIPLLGLAVALIATSPMIGANIAVAIWAVVGFMAMWVIYNHIKVDWRAVVLGIVIISLIIGAFSFLDMRAEPGERSHLARAWESFAQGGVSELWMIVERKAETNLRVLTQTNWTFLLIAVLALLGFMRWRPQGDFAAALHENPGYSAAMAGCLIGGFTAYFTEDSGIVIPALIAIYVGVGILHLMLSRLPNSAADTVDRGVV